MSAVDAWLEQNRATLIECDVRSTTMTPRACAGRWVSAARREQRRQKSLLEAALVTVGLECLGCASGCDRAKALRLVTPEDAKVLITVESPIPFLRPMLAEVVQASRPAPSQPLDFVCRACGREEARVRRRSLSHPEFSGYCRICMSWVSRCIKAGGLQDTPQVRQKLLDQIPSLWLDKTCKRVNCTRTSLVWTPLGDPLLGYCKTCITSARVKLPAGSPRQDLAQWLSASLAR